VQAWRIRNNRRTQTTVIARITGIRASEVAMTSGVQIGSLPIVDVSVEAGAGPALSSSASISWVP
jgi:hypothetical protein